MSERPGDVATASGPVVVDRDAGLRMYDDYLAAHPAVPRRDHLEVVCFERFTLVWPPDLAD